MFLEKKKKTIHKFDEMSKKIRRTCGSFELCDPTEFEISLNWRFHEEELFSLWIHLSVFLNREGLPKCPWASRGRIAVAHSLKKPTNKIVRWYKYNLLVSSSCKLLLDLILLKSYFFIYWQIKTYKLSVSWTLSFLVATCFGFVHVLFTKSGMECNET